MMEKQAEEIIKELKSIKIFVQAECTLLKSILIELKDLNQKINKKE